MSSTKDPFVQFQMSLSTAEEEAIQMTGGVGGACLGPIPADALLPTGAYRLILGELHQLFDIHAPFAKPPKG
jgi:hypothetical protein